MDQDTETARNANMAEFEMGGRERLEITPEVLDLWRQYQDELAKHGVSHLDVRSHCVMV
jgi:hypothetical protein